MSTKAPELMESRYVSVAIARPPREVYAFASDPLNLPRWASGLAGSVQQLDGEWRATSPLGEIRILMTPANELGVLDHDVILESGVSVHNPLRVMPNGNGSEVVFVLFRRSGMSDEQLAEDARVVQHDLATLRQLLEAR